MRPSDEHQPAFNQPDLMAEAKPCQVDDDNILAALECDDWHTRPARTRKSWGRGLGGACALAALGLLAWAGANQYGAAPDAAVIPFAVLAEQSAKPASVPVPEAPVLAATPVAALAPLPTPQPAKSAAAVAPARAQAHARVAARAPSRPAAQAVASPGDSDVMLISALIAHANSTPPMTLASARLNVQANTCSRRGARSCRSKGVGSPST